MTQTAGFFVTGTDTGVGKTIITASLLNQFRHEGFSTAGIKPLSTGGMQTSKGWCNEDVMKIQPECSVPCTADEINPINFKPAIAPEIAAEEVGFELTADKMLEACQPMMRKSADITLIEGIGGWEVPLNSEETQADFAKKLDLPIILVVGIRLGCLNHALLTRAAILRSQLKIAGWIANCIFPEMPFQDENIKTLKQKFKEPLLGIVPFSPEPQIDKIGKKLKLPLELNKV